MLFNVRRKFLYGLWPLSPSMATLITVTVMAIVLFAGMYLHGVKVSDAQNSTSSFCMALTLHLELVVVVVCFFFFFFIADENSWWRSGGLAQTLWTLDSYITFSWWQELCSNTFRAM